VSDTLAGKKIRCPKCAAVAPIPSAPLAAPMVRAVAPAPRPTAPAPKKPAVTIEPVQEMDEAPAPEMDEVQELEDADVPDLQPEGDEIENEEPATPRSKVAPPPKKRGSLVPIVVSVLVVAYVTGAALVYFGILMPLPKTH
jgi:hypothetical protein